MTRKRIHLVVVATALRFSVDIQHDTNWIRNLKPEVLVAHTLIVQCSPEHDFMDVNFSYCERGLQFPVCNPRALCDLCDLCWSTCNGGVECSPFVHDLPDSRLVEPRDFLFLTTNLCSYNQTLIVEVQISLLYIRQGLPHSPDHPTDHPID